MKLYLDNIKVIYNDNDILLPISDIQILVIDNYKSSLSIPLINKLTENNVCTVVCGIDHIPKSYILPMNGHFSQSGNINKQIEWDNNRKQIMHQKIVRAKIHNQAEILKVNNKSQDVKMYFRELFGDDFIRFDEDVINAGLNYGYSIFRSLISSIIVAKGYLPNLGIFHRGKQNMFNLSDDVIEVFRPIVDHYVYNNMMEDILFKQEHREALIQLTAKKIEIDGRKQTVNNAIYVYLESILKELETSKDVYLFPKPILYDL